MKTNIPGRPTIRFRDYTTGSEAGLDNRLVHEYHIEFIREQIIAQDYIS